jgi:septal ring factor EnvC (AmiA/AmiB activator)
MVKQPRTRTANKLAVQKTGLILTPDNFTTERNGICEPGKNKCVVEKDIRAVEKDITAADDNIRVAAKVIREVDNNITAVDKIIRAVDKNIRAVYKNIREVDKDIRAVEKAITGGGEEHFIVCIVLISSVLRHLKQNKIKLTGGKNVKS